MSVHACKRARGRTAYEVVWRDAAGGQRCETYATRGGRPKRATAISAAKVYATALDRYLMPRLGGVAIRDLEPADVVALQRDYSHLFREFARGERGGS